MKRTAAILLGTLTVTPVAAMASRADMHDDRAGLARASVDPALSAYLQTLAAHEVAARTPACHDQACRTKDRGALRAIEYLSATQRQISP